MISPDFPINSIYDDTLNRAEFAKNLASILLQRSFVSSFTIGIYGEWGSGKTSLINMVLDYAGKSNNKPIIIKFNPWLCTNEHQVVSQFFKQLASAIQLQAYTNGVWKLINKYADLFDTVEEISGLPFVIKQAVKALRLIAKGYVEESFGDLQAVKNEIAKKLSEINSRIIVAIDDIDRLSEDEIVVIFQLVKAIADFPNTVYLLAFDYNVVVNALCRVQSGDGRAYLEKIIQVPFEIPAPTMQSIYGTFFSRINEILVRVPESKWDNDAWRELFEFGLKFYLKSIRDVIRFSNVLFLKYEPMLQETDAVDLLGITCLQVFEPALYSLIPTYKSVLCGDFYYNWSYNEHYDKPQIQAKETVSYMLNRAVVANEDAAKNILCLLFPKMRSVIEKPSVIGENYNRGSFIVRGKIAAPECFDRFFTLTLEKESIPAPLVKYILFEASEQDIIQEIQCLHRESEDKVIRLVEEICAFYNSSQNIKFFLIERSPVIIKCLCILLSTLSFDQRTIWPYSANACFLYCIDLVLQSLGVPQRCDCMSSVFSNAKISVNSLALLLQYFGNQHGLYQDDDANSIDKTLPIEDVKNLEMTFYNRATDAVIKRSFLKSDDGLNFFWLLEKIDSKFASIHKKILVKSDLSLVRVITYCTTEGNAASGRSAWHTWKVHGDMLNEFIDCDDAYSRIIIYSRTLQFSLLSHKTHMAVSAFMLYMESKVDSLWESVPESKVKERLKHLLKNET